MDRHLLNIFIFLAQHMLLACGAFFLLWALALSWGPLRRQMHRLSPTLAHRLGLGVALAVLVGFVGVGVWYLALDGFAGEVEPLVTSLSWLVNSGEPLYHDFAYAQRYSVLYGPSVFLTNGLFLKVFGPSVLSAKLASLLGVFGSLVFLMASLARPGRRQVAFGVTALAALYLWSQGFSSYLVRPDSLLLFAVGLALFAVVKMGRLSALVTLAVMLAYAMNLKVHAAVYFLPILVLAVRRFGWRSVLTALVGSAVIIAAPFLLHPQVSALEYVGWIRNAMNQGLGMQTLAATTQYSAYLLLPVVVLLLISPRRVSLLRRHALVLGSLILAFLATLILAEKPGAGLVHLLPLVPTTMYLLGLLILDMVDDPAAMPGPGVLPRAAVTAVLMTVLLGGVVNVYRAVRLVGWQSDEMPGLAEEVRGIIAQYPDLTIGMACGGENASFRSTWMHPLLVFAGHPLLVETVAVMDCRLTGMDMPPASFDALEDGMVKLWLVPRGQQPFVKRNWYPPHEALFSDRFRNHFETNYTPRGHTEYYDLWWWNGLEGE